jgi:hypothetical protein
VIGLRQFKQNARRMNRRLTRVLGAGQWLPPPLSLRCRRFKAKELPMPTMKAAEFVEADASF